MSTKLLKRLFIAFLLCVAAITFRDTVAFTENSSKGQGGKTPVQEGVVDNLSFKWALLHRDKQGKIEVLDFKKNPAVTSGDFLKIFILPLKDVHIYVFLYDSQKRLSPLFSQETDIHKVGKKPYYIPDEKGWFEIDANTGTETFYLIASRERLTDLERLTMEYTNASPEKKDEAKLIVLAEIKKVRQYYSKLTTPGEKPVPIAGTFRGEELKPGLTATQVEAEDFYGKTLRLEHK